MKVFSVDLYTYIIYIQKQISEGVYQVTYDNTIGVKV